MVLVLQDKEQIPNAKNFLRSLDLLQYIDEIRQLKNGNIVETVLDLTEVYTICGSFLAREIRRYGRMFKDLTLHLCAYGTQIDLERPLLPRYEAFEVVKSYKFGSEKESDRL